MAQTLEPVPAAEPPPDPPGAAKPAGLRDLVGTGLVIGLITATITALGVGIGGSVLAVTVLSDRIDDTNARITRLEQRMDARFAAQDAKIDRLDDKIDHLDDKIDRLDDKIDRLDDKIDAIGIELAKLVVTLEAAGPSAAGPAEGRDPESHADAAMSRTTVEMYRWQAARKPPT